MPRTATGPNGEKLVLKDGEWVPLEPSELDTFVAEGIGKLQRSRRFGQEVLRTGTGATVANLLSLPHASGELLAAGAAVPPTAIGALLDVARGRPANLGERYGQNRAEQESQFPANLLLGIPDVTTEQVLAVPGAIVGSIRAVNANRERAMQIMQDPRADVGPVQSPKIRDTYAAALAAEHARAEKNPIAHAVGQGLGDVASLLTLRPGPRMAKALRMGRTNPRADTSDAKSALDLAAKSLARGLGRTAEAGFEGAVLAAVGDADPVKTAAYTAGVQAGASIALSAKHSIMRNPIKAGVGIYAGHEIWKVIAPGPQDFFDSKDAAFQEVVGAYVVGSLAGLAGGGRGGVGSGKIKELTSLFNDTARHSIQSVITQLNDARSRGDTQYEKVVAQLSADPDYFGQEARILIERASRSEEPNALLNQIDSLMRSTRFKRKFDAIGQ